MLISNFIIFDPEILKKYNDYIEISFTTTMTKKTP